MEIVTLDHGDIKIGFDIGWARRLVGIDKSGTYDIDNQNPRLLAQDLKSAYAELAVAKYTEAYWNGNLQNFKAADAGKLQVRSTDHENGSLIIHRNEKDKDEDIFVLAVTNEIRLGEVKVKLMGWILGEDGKRGRFWKKPREDRPAAFFVNQSALYPMSDLVAKKPVRRRKVKRTREDISEV